MRKGHVPKHRGSAVGEGEVSDFEHFRILYQKFAEMHPVRGLEKDEVAGRHVETEFLLERLEVLVDEMAEALGRLSFS